jgi:hypothetical protein
MVLVGYKQRWLSWMQDQPKVACMKSWMTGLICFLSQGTASQNARQLNSSEIQSKCARDPCHSGSSRDDSGAGALTFVRFRERPRWRRAGRRSAHRWVSHPHQVGPGPSAVRRWPQHHSTATVQRHAGGGEITWFIFFYKAISRPRRLECLSDPGPRGYVHSVV